MGRNLLHCWLFSHVFVLHIPNYPLKSIPLAKDNLPSYNLSSPTRLSSLKTHPLANQQNKIIKKNQPFQIWVGLALPFSSQVRTLGPTSFGTIVGEHGNEICFPRWTTMIRYDLWWWTKIRHKGDFHLSPGDSIECNLVKEVWLSGKEPGNQILSLLKLPKSTLIVMDGNITNPDSER